MILPMYTTEEAHSERLRLLKKAWEGGLTSREEEEILDILERRWSKEIHRILNRGGRILNEAY